jgi:tungstate transport system permease protein
MPGLSPELLQITGLSLYVATSSTAIASLLGIPLGTFLALREEARGRKPTLSLAKAIIFTLYGMPPVLAGLLAYLLLSKEGPLGALGWLFTPAGMILAQVFILTPIITGVTYSAVASVGREVKDAARTLGAKGWPLARTVIDEARLGVMTAVMVGFGRAISEVGAVLMVGGNIRGSTRVLTTAIILETGRGDFAEAVMLGGILLAIGFAIFLVLYWVQNRGWR